MNIKILGSLSLCLVFSTQVFADFTCPLSNPAYKNLKTAAEALEQKIVLPGGCEEMAKTINEANTIISSSLKSVDTIAGGTSQNQAHLDSALTGITQVSQIIGSDSKCSKALITTGDYIVAFTDTIMAMSPLLMTVPNPASLSYVMGAQVLGSSVKTFVAYPDKLKVDMSSSKTRQAFIENACGYYRLNENKRSFLQLLKGEHSEIEKLIVKLQKEVKDLEAAAPPKPQMDEFFTVIDTEYAKDKAYFSELEGIIARTSSDAMKCEMVKSQVSSSLTGSFPSKLFSGLHQLLQDSKSKEANVTAKENVLMAAVAINKPELFNTECAKKAADWMQAMTEVLRITNAELSIEGRRNLDGTSAGTIRKEWEVKFAKKKEELESTKGRHLFLKALVDKGMEVELSELLDVRDNVRRELFGDGKDLALFGLSHKKRAAESWLSHKWRSSKVQLKEYKRLIPFIDRSWLTNNVIDFPTKKEKDFACAYVENAVMTINTAEKHIEATELFCETFQHTINSATHPHVTRYCLGKFKYGEKEIEGRLEKMKQSVLAEASNVARFTAWMKKAKCSPPRVMESISI